MSREKRGPDGLTVRERSFATHLCKGMPVKDAYRAAGLGGRSPVPHGDGSGASHAYVMAKRPHIVMFMNEWLRQARLSDIDSPGAALAGVLQDLNEAREDRNWTATAALGRLRFQANGIAEKTQISVEAHISDQDLIRRITGDDPGKMGLLSSLLRPKTFSDQLDQVQPLLLEATAADDDDQQ